MPRSTYEEVRIGPFTGGLNTLSDQSSIDDLELFELVNFELDKDGSLVSRPPIFEVTVGSFAGTGIEIIGYYVVAATGAYYVIFTDRTGSTYQFASGVATLITNTFAASSCVQFRDDLWLLAPLASANPGGTWTPAGGFVAVGTMPKGSSIVVNKDRLWVAQGKDAPTNGSRVYVSDVNPGPVTWDGDFINVSQGDGQNVVDLAVVYSDLIIFKQRSTYRFSYGTDPATGYLNRISSNIGAAEKGCYVAYEDRLFVLFEDNVYEFTNYIFNRLNETVPLKAGSPSASLFQRSLISVFADRIFVTYYDKLYVYSLITRTWSEWESPKVATFGRFFPVPELAATASAYLFSTQPAGESEAVKLFRIYDSLVTLIPTDATNSEDMACSLETKNYDFQSPSRFKRLRMWGVDALLRNDINVIAKPVAYGQQVTWGFLGGYTWGQVGASTWGRLLNPAYVVADSVTVDTISAERKWIKFLKSLRFRQIAFRIEAMTSGTQQDAPIRIFNISTDVKEKQLVPGKIN